MALFYSVSILSFVLRQVLAQPGIVSPLAQACPGFLNNTDVICISRYASFMPPSFSRQSSTGGMFSSNDTFVDTQAPSDPSFQLVKNATFVVFDQRDNQILGSAPKLEHIFPSRNDSIHEGPVYVPALDTIIFSLLHQGIYQQQIIHLNVSTPRLENYTTTPSTYMLPGIYELDPSTGEVATLLNNYFGQAFNSPNDLWIDAQGDIWFTDSWIVYAINVTVYTVSDLLPGVYLLWRIALLSLMASARLRMGVPCNLLYAFDVVASPAGSYIINKHLIYLAQTFGDDGVHVSRNGYLLAAEGGGITVLSAYGELLLRIETGFSVNNIQFAGPERTDLWIFGEGPISRVTWDLVGMTNE